MNPFEQFIELESQKAIEKIMAVIEDDSQTDFVCVQEIMNVLEHFTNKVDNQLPPSRRHIHIWHPYN